MKLVVAVSGASGVELGIRLIESVPSGIELYTVMSDNARTVASLEASGRIFDDTDIGAAIASGSFQTDAMIIAPCSMNTLAKIACGISDNLTTRAAAVMIKEQRRLLIAPRELPFSPIALENMLKLSRIGVIIAPPIPGYYAQNNTVEAMEDFIIGKWFDQLGIEHNLYRRWGTA